MKSDEMSLRCKNFDAVPEASSLESGENPAGFAGFEAGPEAARSSAGALRGASLDGKLQ